MAAFIKRTRTAVAVPLHLPYLPTAHTPDYTPPTTSDWLMNPDLSGVSGVDPKYWEVVGETVSEMSQADKDAVDAAILGAHNSSTEALIKSRLAPVTPLDGITATVEASGLVLTVNINSVVVNDQTTVTSDAVATKYVKVCYIYNSTSDSLSVEVFERTDGLYDDLADDEQLAADFGEWSVGPSGVTLVKV